MFKFSEGEEPAKIYVTTLYSVIIQIENGNVTKITWDNFCKCQSCYTYKEISEEDKMNFNLTKDAEDKNCKTPIEECEKTPNSCDPQVFLYF